MTFYFEWVDSDFMLSKVFMKMLLNSILVFILLFVFKQIKGKSKISLDHPHNLLVIVTVSLSAIFHVYQDQHHRSFDFFICHGTPYSFDYFFDLLFYDAGQCCWKKRKEKTKVSFIDLGHFPWGCFGLLWSSNSSFVRLRFFWLWSWFEIASFYYLWHFFAFDCCTDGSLWCNDSQLHEHFSSSKNRFSQ